MKNRRVTILLLLCLICFGSVLLFIGATAIDANNMCREYLGTQLEFTTWDGETDLYCVPAGNGIVMKVKDVRTILRGK